MVPDADANLFSLGVGYTRNNFTIDLATMVLVLDDRHTRRNLDGLNGKYTSTGISFLMGCTYFF
jgi:long-subunit fatty acid transport protein